MTLDLREALSYALDDVGFKKADLDVDVAEGLLATQWKSTYAHLYLIDASSGAVSDWNAAVAKIDRAVLNNLKADEVTGGILDAHVCFLIDEDAKHLVMKQLDEKKVRNVARKYWIDKAEGLPGFESRLTLLGISQLNRLEIHPVDGLTSEDRCWADQIVNLGPTNAFADFLSKTGCQK